MEERKKQLKKDAQVKTTAAQSDHTKVVEHQKSQAAIIVIEERNKEQDSDSDDEYAISLKPAQLDASPENQKHDEI